MSYQADPAFMGLFRAFTGAPDSIGNRLTQALASASDGDPILVSTGSDMVLFPGAGQAPQVRGFRKSTRGFFELTAVSHLPLALAYLARLRELSPQDDTRWRAEAEGLVLHAQRTRAANSTALWRDQIAVGSLAGIEHKVARVVDYTCAGAIACLQHVLAQPQHLTFDHLRANFFDAPASAAMPVPMNDVMFGTFGLAYLDIVYRIGTWLRSLALDWSRAMVLVSGQSGRPTAGASWASNNICHLIWSASQRRLAPERLFVAPFATPFVSDPAPDEAAMRTLEHGYRALWLNTRASVEVARRLFQDSPGYQFVPEHNAGMPPLLGVDDRAGASARLRRIMEDPSQLLSNCVADYIVDQLHANDNNPAAVAIPGFSNVDYPPLPGE